MIPARFSVDILWSFVPCSSSCSCVLFLPLEAFDDFVFTFLDTAVLEVSPPAAVSSSGKGTPAAGFFDLVLFFVGGCCSARSGYGRGGGNGSVDVDATGADSLALSL